MVGSLMNIFELQGQFGSGKPGLSFLSVCLLHFRLMSYFWQRDCVFRWLIPSPASSYDVHECMIDYDDFSGDD